MDSQDLVHHSPQEVFYSANTSPVYPRSTVPSIAVTTTEAASPEEVDTPLAEHPPTTFNGSPTSVYTIALTGFCYCGKPCDDRCGGCYDTPGYEDTYYCSSTCQQANKPAHAQFCRALNKLRTLHRAAECLQEIYYMYRSKTFDRAVVSINKTVTEGHTRLIVNEDKPRRVFTNDLQFLHKLSYKLFNEEYQDDEDNENVDKRAILSHGVGALSTVWMHDIIGYFLANVACAINEQRVAPVAGNTSVLRVDSKGYPDLYPREHFIFVINLLDAAGTYAFDLCGAQFGYHETVTPFAEYTARGIPNAPPTPFSGKDSIRWGIDAVRLEQSRRGALTRVNMLASEKLVSGAVEWEKEYGTRISTMLQATPEIFQNRKEGLLHYLAYEVQTRLDDMAVKAREEELAWATSASVAAANARVAVLRRERSSRH